MRLNDVQHQPRAISILRRALASGRTHHAYLFDGPEGVGKELTATALAARLLCLDERSAPDADACGKCESCRLLAGGNHPDFHLIHRGLHKFHPDRTVRQRLGLFLTVDLVRHFLIEPASNAPSLGRRRVFVLRDAERMNEQAQNALLKTLEEPPGQACLILVTSAAGRLLPTIRSRCQRVPFDFLPADYVRERLTATRVAPAEARLLALLAQGSLGAALRWAEAGLLEELPAAAEFVKGASLVHPAENAEKLVEAGRRLALRLAGAKTEEVAEADDERDESATDEGDEPDGGEPAATSRGSSKQVPTDQLRDGVKLVLLLVATVLREALVERTGSAAEVRAFDDPPQVVAALAGYFDGGRLAEAIEAVALAERMLDRNVQARMACEYLCAAILGEGPAVPVVL